MSLQIYQREVHLTVATRALVVARALPPRARETGEAEGYTTYRSPEGADGGADILAGGGELGFGKPQICVEVKSGSDPVDRPTVDKLIVAGQKFSAETCLFVSWGGFRPNVRKELARDFFRVRLWSHKDLLENLLTHYDRLPKDICLALPLKRLWMVAQEAG